MAEFYLATFEAKTKRDRVTPGVLRFADRADVDTYARIWNLTITSCVEESSE